MLHVLYLVFSEGYTASDGDELTVPALSREAIRLTRWLHRLLPEDSEVAGLLALMLNARPAGPNAATWPSRPRGWRRPRYPAGQAG